MGKVSEAIVEDHWQVERHAMNWMFAIMHQGPRGNHDWYAAWMYRAGVLDWAGRAAQEDK